jgi:hypothetical protein
MVHLIDAATPFPHESTAVSSDNYFKLIRHHEPFRFLRNPDGTEYLAIQFRRELALADIHTTTSYRDFARIKDSHGVAPSLLLLTRMSLPELALPGRGAARTDAGVHDRGSIRRKIARACHVAL